MPEIRVTSIEPAEARALAALAAEADRVEPLGESVWRDLAAPGRRSFDVVAVADGRPRAFAHVFGGDGHDRSHRELGLVAPPEARDVDLVTRLLRTALREIGAGEDVVAWFPGAPAYALEAAPAARFVLERRLHRMERSLDGDLEPAWPAGVAVTTFEPGVDDEAWLAVNNRAFAGHLEQGGWTAGTLARRIEEPWFDPSGFLLARHGDDLAGFCWTKQHPGGVGEIYVIAVDPSHQAGGFGRALVVAGLASLRARGSTTGMLYVDADQEAAVTLYRSLAFEVVRTDVAYLRARR